MFAVLHFPQFPLQAVLRHEPALWERPVALVDAGMTTPRVVEATARARDEGVTEGLTAPQALARCRTVLIRHRVPAQETLATEAILQCAFGFSPNLEATAPGWVTLDLRGLAELRAHEGAGEGEAERRVTAWGERLRGALGQLGLEARVGVGATPNVARHAARWDSRGETPQENRAEAGKYGGVTWVTDPAAFLARLPVSALEPSSDVAAILQRWGVRTVGELLALGQAALAERLGLEALGLFAAASVSASRPLNLVKPVERFEEAHEFESEVETIEPLLFLLRRFTDGLSRRLEVFGWVAGWLRLRLRLESGMVLDQALRVPQPTRRADVLFRMLHTHLESLRTPSPVKAVELRVEPTRPEQRQFGLFESALRDPNQFQETLARLAALVGADRVGSPVREDSHRPDAFTLVAPDFDPEHGASVGSPAGGRRPVPLRRLRPGLPAQVGEAAEEGSGVRPLTVRCTLAGGPVGRALGPWRTSGHWWEAGGWERDEWDVSLGGGRVLRLALQRGTWVVEGVLD